MCAATRHQRTAHPCPRARPLSTLRLSTPAFPLIYARLTISLQGPTLLTSLLHSSRRTRSSPRTACSSTTSRTEASEQGGADSSTHRRSEKPDEIAQWRYVTEVCAPHAYSVLMHVSQGKPDFVAPLAPRNLAIFDDAFDDYGALDSLYENDMLESVPVASGEQSNYEQALAARRTYKRKQSQRASAPSRGSAVVAVASWRRVR